MASVARSRWILVFVLLALIAGVWWARRRPPQYSVAYVAQSEATLWSATSQVRQPVATLGYGERVAVMRHSGDQAEVRAGDGAQGWMNERLLMDSDLWNRAADLLARARIMPVQARGHTRALSNVHVEPGRDTPRIFQFERNVPVVVLERKVAEAPAPGKGAPGEEGASPDEGKPKGEDWLLVSRATQEMTGAAGAGTNSPSAPSPNPDAGPDTPIAGWVLSRFVELDPPQPIPDYFSSAGVRVVAWVVLDTAADKGGAKPQYLVAGIRGGEGQPCDFALLRVYTWDAKLQRYETAYVEDRLCGSLPLRVRQTPAGIEFRFAEVDENNAERVYRMKQTVVRRVRENQPPAGDRR